MPRNERTVFQQPRTLRTKNPKTLGHARFLSRRVRAGRRNLVRYKKVERPLEFALDAKNERTVFNNHAPYGLSNPQPATQQPQQPQQP